jgi:long-chain fatty acid adenylase/transferase FadD26
MSAIDSSISAVLGERARRQPDARAYTFIDYELDPAGDSETLTWFQVHRRAQVVAAELASRGSSGDRVAILAPQGLEYIVGVLGAMEAGFIAVPMSAPQFGAHDERVLVPPTSIPITTSGKVRRSACAERYRQDEFTRLDTPA